MQRVCLDGYSSAWVYVLSGVPQRSVLGPLLFLIFINDLKLDILSLILKFAEDTKVFGRVSNSVQRQLLQDDLDKLCVWADSWQMEFNVAKCKAICTSEVRTSSSAI